MNFSDLGLSDEVLRAVADAGYTTPTPIQQQAIPQVLMGRDILGCAQTGTGKTASFTLPMIEILAAGRARARMPRSLILEPTRELAAQVADNFETYGKNHKLTKALLIGGVSMDDQVRVLDRGVDVLIATPGRLLDMFERGRLLLSDVKVLVIDEADRMLDMGFIPDVERIVSLVARIRQTLFFSATMPPEIRRLADAFLMNPKEISVSPPSTPSETVVQGLLMVDKPRGGAPGSEQKNKRAALRDLIRREDVKNALVFCNRKRDVGVVHRSLQRHGFDAAQLHGDMPQSARGDTLKSFKDGNITLLVCSDVAARGLDIAEMSHVFNFDVPTHAEDYVHRIGRTGRAGRKGRAFTIATSADRKYLASIESLIGKAIPPVGAAAEKSAEKTDENESQPRSESRPSKNTASGDEKEAPKSGRSRRRGGRSRRGKDSSSQDSSPRQAPVEAAAEPSEPIRMEDGHTTEDDRPGGNDRDRDRGRGETRQPPKRGRRDGGKGDQVVGMGEHTPAFMLRPVKTPKN